MYATIKSFNENIHEIVSVLNFIIAKNKNEN